MFGIKCCLNIMRILHKLNFQGRTLLTLEGDVLEINAKKVIVDGREFDFDIAYDMKDTIGIKTEDVISQTVVFK